MRIQTDISKLVIKGDEEELREVALSCMDAIDKGMSKGQVGEIRIKFVNEEWDRDG